MTGVILRDQRKTDKQTDRHAYTHKGLGEKGKERTQTTCFLLCKNVQPWDKSNEEDCTAGGHLILDF